jgi:hypothetical protein
MKWLAFTALIACSNSQRTAVPERTAAAEAGPKVAAAPDAAIAPDAAPARSKEVEDALHEIWSEHGGGVPPVEFWKAHAAEVRPPLRALLEDGPDGGIGDDWALRILGDLGDPADVELLVKSLNESTYETVRGHAASALGHHPAPAAGEALIAATKLKDMKLAPYAVTGLGYRKADPAARTRLEELLDHADSTMRYRAVGSLAELGGSKAALTKRLKVEKDAEIKTAIKKALQAK